MRWLLVLLVLGCEHHDDRVARFFYENFGWTHGGSKKVTTKEIHLDGGISDKSAVLVIGNIINLGEHSTHLVIDDNSGRLLVVLTELRNLKELNIKEDMVFEFYGHIERGKKGYPYLKAKYAREIKEKGNTVGF